MMKKTFEGNKLFWIIGLRRSGTSILRELIMRSPDVAGIEFEPHPLWFAVDMNHFARFQNIPFVQATLDQFALRRSRLYGAKFALNPGVKALEWVWLDKTFSNSKFIFILRETDKTYISYEKEDQASVRGMIEFQSYRRLSIDLKNSFMMFAKRNPDRAVYVHYEHMLRNADHHLSHVFELLGARAPANLQRFIKSPRH
jgi:hypothetical protein